MLFRSVAGHIGVAVVAVEGERCKPLPDLLLAAGMDLIGLVGVDEVVGHDDGRIGNGGGSIVLGFSPLCPSDDYCLKRKRQTFFQRLLRYDVITSHLSVIPDKLFLQCQDLSSHLFRLW